MTRQVQAGLARGTWRGQLHLVPRAARNNKCQENLANKLVWLRSSTDGISPVRWTSGWAVRLRAWWDCATIARLSLVLSGAPVLNRPVQHRQGWALFKWLVMLSASGIGKTPCMLFLPSRSCLRSDPVHVRSPFQATFMTSTNNSPRCPKREEDERDRKKELLRLHFFHPERWSCVRYADISKPPYALCISEDKDDVLKMTNPFCGRSDQVARTPYH